LGLNPNLYEDVSALESLITSNPKSKNALVKIGKYNDEESELSENGSLVMVNNDPKS